MLAVKSATEGRAVVEIVHAEDLLARCGAKVEVPVLLKQPSLLKPFALLVSGYGTPSYGTIDPTPFVGITFLFMFGMMFGDVGHGLALLLTGLVTAWKSTKWRDAGKLGIYCGVASMIFGTLYGSFLGLDSVLPTLWVRPLQNITGLFKVAIGFGVAVISLGIALNIANSIITHSFLENLFDKAGPVIGVVYWACVGLAVKWMISGKAGFSRFVLYAFVAIPLVAFGVRGPILKLLGRQKRALPGGISTYIMESIVELLEILMGYLANTVSFIRIAAFGLAHAGLFIVVFNLARVVAAKPGGAFLSWTVLVFGNTLIILLEGLVVTIQALRLEYYEFFGKFFKGMGSRYEPTRLFATEVVASHRKGGE